MKVSLFQNIKNTTPKVASKCIFKVFDSIKNGDFKNTVAKIRIETDKEKRNELKSKLYYVTFCGTFSTRGNDNLKKHSGLACLDFDDVQDLALLTEKVNNDNYTFASFVSPSGNGLKVLVKIPFVDNNNDYQDFYIQLQKHYNSYGITDDATKAIANACYLSFDEKLFLNTNSLLFSDKYNRPQLKKIDIVNIPLTDKNAVADKLEKWFVKRWSSTNRNTNLHAYARQMNAFGVDKTICEQYLLRYEMNGFRSKEIMQLINSAYKYTNEFHTSFFEDSERVRDVKNLVIAGQSIDKIKTRVTDVSTSALELEINKHTEVLKTDEFWYYNEKGTVKLATFRFLNYLENNQISKYYPDSESDTYLFIKKENNLVAPFGVDRIKDFILMGLRSRGNIDAFELMANNNNSFSSNFLSMIKTSDITINRDTIDKSYLYYKNYAVETTKEGSKVVKYDTITDLIWKNQIIDRNIVLNTESKGEFKTFLWKLSAENPERYYTLKSVIGYLMHSYQNESKPKAIIFNDEMISEDVPNGGSGKGLIHKAIGHIKNIVIEDGKKFDPRGQFAYQKVKKDTQIFLMDDVPKNFNFESLFSLVTEGITVEKKGKDAYQIPFKESPKISITTNYTINGAGASFNRRVFEVEIANYFNEYHTPEDEFKHQFFSEWSSEEWANFDNFMIRCVQFFLKNGLVESNKVNLDFRKLKNSLGAEFIEFMEGQTFQGEHLDRKEFRDKFNAQYPTLARFNSAQKFNGKVKDYCNFNKINFEESKYNGTMKFVIGDKPLKAPF